MAKTEILGLNILSSRIESNHEANWDRRLRNQAERAYCEDHALRLRDGPRARAAPLCMVCENRLEIASYLRDQVIHRESHRVES